MSEILTPFQLGSGGWLRAEVFRCDEYNGGDTWVEVDVYQEGFRFKYIHKHRVIKEVIFRGNELFDVLPRVLKHLERSENAERKTA